MSVIYAIIIVLVLTGLIALVTISQYLTYILTKLNQIDDEIAKLQRRNKP